MGDMELQIFADRLKELRTRENLTQAQFVDGLGITASALSAYEKNLKNPSISVAKRIAEKYHVSIDWLCGLSDVKNLNDEPQTYADIIDLLTKAEFAIRFKIIDDCKIFVCEPVLNYFLKDWGKMIDLYHEGIIDQKLYSLWLRDKKSEFDVHLGNDTEIVDFMTKMDEREEQVEEEWNSIRGITPESSTDTE